MQKRKHIFSFFVSPHPGGTLVRGSFPDLWGGTPVPGSFPGIWSQVPPERGTPVSDRGYLSPRWRGTPILAGGVLQDRTPLGKDSAGVPPGRTGASLGRTGVHIGQDRTRVSSGQNWEYLLCGRWYASCCHTGGLSCFSFFPFFFGNFEMPTF